MKQVRMYHVELVRESSKLYDVDTIIDSSTKAPKVIREVLKVERWHNEKFGVACLDTQNKLIGLHIVSEGTVNEAAVYPREIAVRALLNNATSAIIFHNHPGGSTKPSSADIAATKNIKTVLETLQIKLIDHIIMTETEYTSFAEKGLL
jgi:DNA repair protein RadC